jgi:LDH2 family malate/lactate/ureidoglycolate dehydrogenase
VFIAFDLKRIGDPEETRARVGELTQHLKFGRDGEAEAVRFPGENVWAQRQYNLVHGAPVADEVWSTITGL